MPLLSSVFEKIQAIDVKTMVFINRDLSNPVFDFIMPWLRESVFWLPFYLFLFSWGILNLGKKAFWWIFSGIMSIVISDQVSSSFVKKAVGRIRPCKDPDVMPYILLRLDHCSGAFSFTSSHASNHFALAFFIVSSLQSVVSTRITNWMYLWAGMVGLAQIYVGVHYPTDVIFGSILGLGCGWVANKIYQKTTARLA